jgi:hypothetical protein
MLKITAENGTQSTLDITEEERAVASQVKEDFKIILKKLDAAVKVVITLRDALVEQRPSKDDLQKKYRGRLLRYKKKILNVFNEFLSATKLALEKLSKINDPDMARLREIIVAEVSEMSDGAEAVLDLLGETDRDGFSQTMEQITTQIEKRQRSINDVIDSQLFSHIDHDILGRMKISEMRFRIKRRARLIRLRNRWH